MENGISKTRLGDRIVFLSLRLSKSVAARALSHVRPVGVSNDPSSAAALFYMDDEARILVDRCTS